MDNEVINYLSLIHEYKGRQSTYTKQKPQELERLVEIAKVQSTEASNSIEGIRTTETRLRQLMSERTAPRNRDEKEIAGYRDALNIVHENFDYIPLTPNYILQLHKILLSHTDSGFGGSFKNVQNYISATDEAGKRFTLFTPMAPYETPEAMQEICDEYNRAIGEGKVDPLLIIPVFIHDFLCVTPSLTATAECPACLQPCCCTIDIRIAVSISRWKLRSQRTRVPTMQHWRIHRLAGTSSRTTPLRSSNIC